MNSETIKTQEYAKDISKPIVADVAPEEIPLFEELAAEYFATLTAC